MIKKIVKIGEDELGFEFTDEELKELGLKKGDQIKWFEKGNQFGFKKVKAE